MAVVGRRRASQEKKNGLESFNLSPSSRALFNFLLSSPFPSPLSPPRFPPPPTLHDGPPSRSPRRPDRGAPRAPRRRSRRCRAARVGRGKERLVNFFSLPFGRRRRSRKQEKKETAFFCLCASVLVPIRRVEAPFDWISPRGQVESALSTEKGPQPVEIHRGRRRRQQRKQKSERQRPSLFGFLEKRLYLEKRLALYLSLSFDAPRVRPFLCSIGIRSNVPLALRDRSEEEKVQEKSGEKKARSIFFFRGEELAMGEEAAAVEKKSGFFLHPLSLFSLQPRPTSSCSSSSFALNSPNPSCSRS